MNLIAGLPPLIPYGHMVQEYYVRQSAQLAVRRRQERAAIRSRTDAEELVGLVRSRIRRCFGPFPRRSPLDAVVTGVVEHHGYCIEKIIFQSRPNFPVTANLYLPRQQHSGQQFPGVLGACGHSEEGKAAVNYQAFCRGLVRQGFVVLIYDPIGQGERKQYVNVTHPLIPTGICEEHNMLGNRMQLVGDWFGNWRAWDGIRALDYLLSRPEVDPSRVGLTGNSGGGTISSYLNVLDSRITMFAPSCFITTFERNIANELPQDTEQNPPGFLAAGLDMADYVIARAPRPTILLGQENDFFDVRGLTEAFHEAKRIYALLGAEKNIRLFIGPNQHGYFQKNREAMYRFFAEYAGLKPPAREPRFSSDESVALQCSQSGQVMKDMPEAMTVFENTRTVASSLRRPRLTAGALASAARTLLRIEKTGSMPDFRVLRQIHENGRSHPLCVTRYAIQSEQDIQAILYFLPARATGHRFTLGGSSSAVLYLPHLSARADIDANELDGRPDSMDRFALDVRGTGESLPITCHNEEIFAEYDSDFLYASVGSLLGKPYLGRKVFDVLQTIAVLKQYGYRDIHIVGRGLGAVIGVFAALLSPAVQRVTLKNALLSYTELALQPATRWPFSYMLPGVLRRFDLPDIYRALSKKRLALIDPWNERMEPWTPGECRRQAAALGLRGVKFTTRNA